jgi:mono/diheme cytochrome c family protein
MRTFSSTRAKSLLIGLAVVVAGVVALGASADRSQLSKRAPSQEATTSVNSGGVVSNTQLVARGKYIVEDLAVCTQCHTPHTTNGDLDRSKWLEGAPLWLQPAAPDSNWPLRAPRLAGSPPGSDADLITLLTTGTWRDGQRLRPPMPQFRMSNEDAQAVVAYLRSLSPPIGREP